MNILDKLEQINTFIFDVDGVMTNGSLLIMPGGEYIRTMNVKDGFALQLAVKKGYRIIVVSGAGSAAVEDRMGYLGITETHMGIKDKKKFMLEKLGPEELAHALFMGDDLPDLELAQSVYLSACPADAAPEMLALSAYISPFGGGNGCVRDVVEKVMKLQKKWNNEEHVAAI